jgi:hypothetical protein
MQAFIKELENQHRVSVKKSRRPEGTRLTAVRYPNSDVGAVDDDAHSGYSQTSNTGTVFIHNSNTVGPIAAYRQETNAAPEEPEAVVTLKGLCPNKTSHNPESE